MYRGAYERLLLFERNLFNCLVSFILFFSDFSKSEAGFFVAASALLDLIGRLALGYLSDLQLFDRKKAYVVW